MRMTTSVILACACAAWSAVALAAPVSQPAEPQLKQLSLEQLGDIVVTSPSKQPEEIWNTAAAIDVLTQDDIQRSGATTIPELLRLVPGVQVARIDSDHWAVGVRGLASKFSQSLLVLIDGRSVYSPLYAGVFWDVQNVPVENIDRIEVIRGPGGTIWGANAVNGVINIITKPASQTQGAYASIGGGTLTHALGTFRYGGRAGSADWRAYGTGFTRGPESHPGRPDYDTWHQGQAGFRADWDTDGRNAVTLEGDFYAGRTGTRFLGSYYDPPRGTTVYGHDDVSGGNVNFQWRHQLEDGGNVSLQAYYDRTNRHGTLFGETRNTWDVDWVHGLPSWKRQSIEWGLGARVSPSTFIQTFQTVDFLPHDHTDHVYSAFLQDTVAIAPKRVSLLLGAKLQHNNYTGLEIQPSARLLWTPAPHQSFWAAVTRAVRTPSRIERDVSVTGLASAEPLLFARLLGNPDFQSERLIAYTGGYRTLLGPDLYLDVDAFHNHYLGLFDLGAPSIVVEQTPPPTRSVILFPYVNGIYGTTDGFEAAPRWTPNGWLRVSGGYSYLHLDLSPLPGFNQGPAATDEGDSPSHQVFVAPDLLLPHGVDVSPTWRYASALVADEVPAYQTADLRVAWQVTPSIQLSVTGRNLLQPSHVEFASDTGVLVGIRRTVYAQIAFGQ
jgi:iron complex outermembrane receptor protein